jgi:hypothetical protein
MVHQDFQEAIEQLSTNEDLRDAMVSNPDEVQSRFGLSEEDMMAMKSYVPSMESTTPRAIGYCCSCTIG